jgi:ribonuclease I
VQASFKGFENGRIKWGIKGKNRSIYKDITVADARWLLNQLQKLTDRQIEDAFRAANYSPAEVDMYRAAIKRRIQELEQVTGRDRLAAR